MIPSFRRIVIHPDSVGSAMAGRIRSRLPGLEPVISAKSGGASKGPEKDLLILARHRGRLLKNCPGTPGYVCCGYRVLNLVRGCPLDCTYCILQLYLNRGGIVVHSDWEDALRELHTLVTRRPGRIIRLGTGELADSLALEPLTDMARDLIPLVLRYPEAVLELKTKTTAVESLLGVDSRGRVIVSWSLNADEVAASDEKGAPPMVERLRAAAECRRAGYRIGLHFDPLVLFPGWEGSYARTVEAVYDYLDPGDISWISLGSLRFPPALDAVIRERFPDSRLLLGELLPGLDGKMRYFRPLRVDLYRKIYGEIRKRDRDTEVYLCMESPAVWEEALGRSGFSGASLTRCLDEVVEGSCRTGAL